MRTEEEIRKELIECEKGLAYAKKKDAPFSIARYSTRVEMLKWVLKLPQV